nr:hypothetical protein BaRGS_012720 [Batillaria attramentaria]
MNGFSIDARVCQYKDFFTVQGTCRDQNKNLLEAEEAHNDKLLCKSLYELWYCVAGSVPVCLHNFTELYTRYMHSPHNCQLSHEQIIELQNLTHNVGDGEVDVEVDVQELTTQQPGSSSSSSSSSSSGDDGDGSTTAGDNVKGDTKGHTGSGSRFFMVVVSLAGAVVVSVVTLLVVVDLVVVVVVVVVGKQLTLEKVDNERLRTAGNNALVCIHTVRNVEGDASGDGRQVDRDVM